MIQNVLSESVVIGIITLVFGKILSKMLSIINNKKDSQIKKWSEPPLLSLILFLVGVSIHLVCELMGFNKWYCDKEMKTCVRRLAFLN